MGGQTLIRLHPRPAWALVFFSTGVDLEDDLTATRVASVPAALSIDVVVIAMTRTHQPSTRALQGWMWFILDCFAGRKDGHGRGHWPASPPSSFALLQLRRQHNQTKPSGCRASRRQLTVEWPRWEHVGETCRRGCLFFAPHWQCVDCPAGLGVLGGGALGGPDDDTPG
ncbi:hypothetical protein QBC39DRAFT_17910 [Podospora conica]|nr:hypothetical protein QBC39DRAFT_17910 [Schizothecium conicum]